MKESPIDRHTRVGNSYLSWKRTAETLFESSEILRRERERVCLTVKPGPVPKGIFTTWTAVMLTAFGIECLIKAVWLKQGHQLAQNGKYMEMIKNEGHQLGRLCEAAGFVLSQREEALLARLSEIAGSVGRYPIGRRAPQTSRGLRWSTKDDHIIENLIVRLKTEMS